MTGIFEWEQDALSEKEDSKVGELLLNEDSLSLEDVLQNADWEVFYQLSPMREGLFNWYPFREGCHILELSSGFGGLTGVLCRNAKTVTVLEPSRYRAECISKRYADLDNLMILAGNLKDLPEGKLYDYIIVEKTIDTGEQLDSLLEALSPFLMESGKLLFSCHNRFGMKYWCGVPDQISHKAFGGMAEGGKGLSRQDLLDRLSRNTCLKGFQIYYPFPDERLPQAIYTDEYLPKASIRDRVIPYYTEREQENLVCLESDISDEIVENQVLPFFSNAFMVECGKEAFEKEVVFAALSTDRGVEHGFATIVTKGGLVRKKALFPEGKQSLEQICRNQQELARRGIACVEQRLKGNHIEMPFVEEPTLVERLNEIYTETPEEVEEIFERLYQAIVVSSSHVCFECCTLFDPELTEDNAGIILERAYIDMIPYNCFLYNGEFLFFDQEFVKECYPAKYVLFRALRYTYIYIGEAEQIIPLTYFKEKYALTEVWAAFEREEARFVEENRNYGLYASFYRWAGAKIGTSLDVKHPNIDWCNSTGKTCAMQVEEKMKEKKFQKKKWDIELYKKDYRLKTVKTVQLQLLREFDRVCRENNLAYCAAYGTLLGAVRHKGYIPWDDDLDLMMPRRDFDILTKIAPIVFTAPYFLQTAENDDCFYGGYAKLRDSATTGLDERDQGKDCNQGIWIDILPLDDILEDAAERKGQKERIQYFQKLLYKKTYPEKRIGSVSEEEWYFKISKMFTRSELYAALRDTLVGYGSKLSDRVAVLARNNFWTETVEYDRADFEFLIRARFEDLEIPIPVGYENCLKRDYGEDYRLYPETERRKPHHRGVFDAKKSYIDYLS